MDLSVIIISWNAQAYIRPCLESVVRALDEIDSEIIFINNGSSDDTEKIILQEYPSLIYQNTHKNLGVARARNIGLKLATGNNILFLDIDTVVNKEAFTTLLDVMSQRPDTGICSCKLTSAANEPQLSCLKLPTLPHKFKNVLLIMIVKIQKHCHAKCWKRWGEQLWESNKKYFYQTQMEQTEPFDCEYVIGACQCIRRQLIDQIGMLDEHIFYGPEDADYCIRAWKAGWHVTYIPSVSIIHHYQKITNKKLFSVISWLHVKALLYFFWKHKRIFKTGI